MRIQGYQVPKSSFLSMDKDTGTIVNKIFENKRVQKYLYYNTKDPLAEPDLTEDQVQELMVNNIKQVPKVYVDPGCLNYLLILFDNFSPSGNPEFRDNILEIDIICHYDQWQLRDFQLRPYRIAAELDSMLDKKRLSGIGWLNFLHAEYIVMTDEFAGVCLMYTATHGEDDKKNFPKPEDNEQFIEDFNEMMGQSGS